MSPLPACGIADGHADSLMWNRDLNALSAQGHVDFPRLREAGVSLQCFTIVTRGIPFVDGFPLFAWYRRWPKEARRSPWARALWQLDRLEAFCTQSQGSAEIARRGRDLGSQLGRGCLSAVVGVEGAQALEGKVERVAELYQRGVRFMSLTHLSNNELGGSSYPMMGNRGLTQLGRDVLDEMGRVGMLVDVAHASPRTLDEILAHPTALPFCSHSGVRGAKPLWRNLSDEALKRMADKGGVLGVIFATIYLGGSSYDDVARHIEHAIQVMGEDAVALGSDFDGMIPLPKGMRDVRDVPKLAETLERRGHKGARIEKVLGTNFRRYFTEHLG